MCQLEDVDITEWFLTFYWDDWQPLVTADRSIRFIHIAAFAGVMLYLPPEPMCPSLTSMSVFLGKCPGLSVGFEQLYINTFFKMRRFTFIQFYWDSFTQLHYAMHTGIFAVFAFTYMCWIVKLAKFASCKNLYIQCKPHMYTWYLMKGTLLHVIVTWRPMLNLLNANVATWRSSMKWVQTPFHPFSYL